MNGKKVVQFAAQMIQDQVLTKLATRSVIDDSQCCAKITAALRDAVAEVCRRFPIYRCESLTSVGGLIASAGIADGEKYSVVSVEKSGKDVPFKVDHAGVHVNDDGTYTVTYSPENFNVTLYADFDVAPEVGFSMMVHLVARNYCMLAGRTEEAAMFDSRYNEDVEQISLKRRSRIPARKFV